MCTSITERISRSRVRPPDTAVCLCHFPLMFSVTPPSNSSSMSHSFLLRARPAPRGLIFRRKLFFITTKTLRLWPAWPSWPSRWPSRLWGHTYTLGRSSREPLLTPPEQLGVVYHSKGTKWTSLKSRGCPIHLHPSDACQALWAFLTRMALKSVVLRWTSFHFRIPGDIRPFSICSYPVPGSQTAGADPS